MPGVLPVVDVSKGNLVLAPFCEPEYGDIRGPGLCVALFRTLRNLPNERGLLALTICTVKS
jgi:hypothetical protein